ncbi:hypothetical protein CB0940_07101 [Cercospora beticola]|uniref:Uncharacterized protein n=1 Tax=Cercospora beticola TaxID=122368 RepID=A0A2G5H8K3_CERBT|nr:hypothetical protein CB0940_07101 [Cercospora beticola]PIA88864.1 hypothetical protein CB0940_07101 [Cercospora beticola]WPB03026.1 hypothetical protein RHO25_007662 [Cercospora beticola]CAK1358270.1 unnamed protein product [Cercospora beticola]
MDCFQELTLDICHCGAASCEHRLLAQLREEENRALKQMVRELTAKIDSLRSNDVRANQDQDASASTDCAGAETKPRDGATLWGEIDFPANESGSDSGYFSDDFQSEEGGADAISAEASSDDATEADDASDWTETWGQSEQPTSTTAWDDIGEETFVCTVPDDKKAFWEPSAHSRVAAEVLSDVLDEALLSCSRTVYRAFDKLDRETCFEKWDGPKHVGWGRSEILDALFTRTNFYQVFGGNQEAGKLALDAAVRMRNAACHPCNRRRDDPEACTVEHVDHLLAMAQDLPRMLGNNEEVVVMQGLRDKLQTEAQKTWTELLELAAHPVEPTMDNVSKALCRTSWDFGFALLPKEKDIPLLVAALRQEAESRRRNDTAGPRW